MKYMFLFSLIPMVFSIQNVTKKEATSTRSGVTSYKNVTYDEVIQFTGKVFFELIKAFDTNQNSSTVNLTLYMDKAIEAFNASTYKNKIKKIELPNTRIKLSPAGEMILRNGVMRKLETFNRVGDVNITYNQTSKRAKLIVPFKFEELKFNYNYSTQVSLFTVNGGISGVLKNAMFYTESFFDFVTHKLILDNFTIRYLGDFSMNFSGHRIMDWVMNAMTRAAGGILQPLIVNEVTQNLKVSLRRFLNDLNREIALRFYDYHP